MGHEMTEQDPIDAESLRERAGLATFEQHAELASTMDRGRELATDPETPLPAAVVADLQTLGRGRRGARWWQPPGSLAVSIVLDAASAGIVSDEPVEPRPTWSLAAGVALAESLSAIVPEVDPRVRWPNDIESGGRKLAGILIETCPGGRAIIGIGVNTTGTAAVAPRAIADRVATIPDRIGRPLPRVVLLADFMPRFCRLLVAIAADPGLLVSRYRPFCSLLGSDVTIYRGGQAGQAGQAADPHLPNDLRSTIQGRCHGIDRHGAIVIDTVAGRMHLASGSLTRPDDVWLGDDGPTAS
jgi:BirA family biotin operon repressor/biotin-[acetyl-CoA-carboxylase] ligase